MYLNITYKKCNFHYYNNCPPLIIFNRPKRSLETIKYIPLSSIFLHLTGFSYSSHYHRKRFKLSQKEIEKRIAHGQKSDGYEEYEMTMY